MCCIFVPAKKLKQKIEIMTPRFTAGERVQKGKIFGTVVYNSSNYNNVELVQILWDGKKADFSRWGSSKGVIKIVNHN